MTEIKRTRLSTNLLRRRLEKGYSQRELGEISGLGQSRVCWYETGVHIPSFGSLMQIAAALDTTFQQLLKGVGSGFAEKQEIRTKTRKRRIKDGSRA